MVIKEFQEQMHKVIHRHESAVQDQTCVPNVVAGARTIGGGRAHWRVPPLPGLNGRRLGGSNIWPDKIPDDPRESHVTINPSDY